MLIHLDHSKLGQDDLNVMLVLTLACTHPICTV